jgi:hypothetical protein
MPCDDDIESRGDSAEHVSALRTPPFPPAIPRLLPLSVIGTRQAPLVQASPSESSTMCTGNGRVTKTPDHIEILTQLSSARNLAGNSAASLVLEVKCSIDDSESGRDAVHARSTLFLGQICETGERAQRLSPYAAFPSRPMFAHFP